MSNTLTIEAMLYEYVIEEKNGISLLAFTGYEEDENNKYLYLAFVERTKNKQARAVTRINREPLKSFLDEQEIMVLSSGNITATMFSHTKNKAEIIIQNCQPPFADDGITNIAILKIPEQV